MSEGSAGAPAAQGAGELSWAATEVTGAIARPPRERLPRRRKLWELEEKYHCPVIGTCLDLQDLKRLARRSSTAARASEPYRLHVEAVSASLTRNPAAESMQRLLERKFADAIRRFAVATSDAEVLGLWRQHLERGEVAGAVWAAFTHKAVSEETCGTLFADLHMLSHQVGAGLAAGLRRQRVLERELDAAREQARRDAARHARQSAEQAERVRQLESEAMRAARHREAEAALRARIAELESGADTDELHRRLARLEEESIRLRERAARADAVLDLLEARETDCLRLARERDEAVAARDALERLWLDRTDCPASAACAGWLAGRSVLCVGGRTALLAHYRRLAERLGVRLIHHDGGREEALSRLPDLLCACDAVICPTDCVGHPAYHQVKRHCKLEGKPCVLLKSAGVASFAAALERLTEGSPGISPVLSSAGGDG